MRPLAPLFLKKHKKHPVCNASGRLADGVFVFQERLFNGDALGQIAGLIDVTAA